MDWMDTARELADDPLVRWVVGEGVRGIARRVRRRRPGAAAHSETGPAPAPNFQGAETPVTVTSESTTGKELAESLLQGVGNEQMRAATRLLGAHRGGFWLRRLLDQEAELTAAADKPVIDRSGTHPSIDWDAIGLLMLSRPSAFNGSSSELAVLEVAASLVTRCVVQLGQVIRAVDDTEFRLILRALQEAAYGEAR
ncbi:hypothetical protein [Streptomyces acidiscabies]|uniref:Uncharacterized protein n=1 Tax=Streptomyces acidiscabies TaxID=42234 RepID=A0ABU4MC08_9ACTN|nr:hypothetical protein [Streptomyces acidiscabies]MDX3025386.1 hypothetical protein [Streptomyces acidiscabies]